MDFDDLLMYPYLMFRQYPKILEKRQTLFQYILVDEAQDTNFQSIYGRRGALMENFLNVKAVWPDIEIFKLQMNYRSRPHIVQAGSHIIKNNTKQYEKTIVPHRT